jgi:membrane associated rhomboid family serine protease
MSKNDDPSKLNGHKKQHDQSDKKIVKFPTLADRDRTRKEKLKQDRLYQKQYQAQKKLEHRANATPFFNFEKIPKFTRIFLIATIGIHVVLSIFLDSGTQMQAIDNFGFTPAKITNAEGIDLMAWLSIATHMLLHSSWMHLIFNIIMGLAFGVFFERIFGARRTFKFFVLCGISGAGVYFILNPGLNAPVIGASGAISGLFAAVLILMHERGQMGQMGKHGPWPIVAFWALLMTVLGMLGNGSGENVAWQAHLGGFLAGAGLLYLMRRGFVKL